MLNANYWIKGCQSKNTRVIDYRDLICVITGADSVNVNNISDLINDFEHLKKLTDDDYYDYQIEQLRKLQELGYHLLIEIDSGNGEPIYLGSSLEFDDDFYRALLASNTFFNTYDLHNIIINDELVKPIDKDFVRFFY